MEHMLLFMQDIYLVGNCVSNIQTHGWIIIRVKTMSLGVSEDPHPYGLVGSINNQLKWAEYVHQLCFLCRF